MGKRFRSFRLCTFRLRTLLVFVTITCVGLTAWLRSHEYQMLAQEHHYLSLRDGYRAIERQGSSFDRSTLEAVYLTWERSVRNSRLADHYSQVIRKPWIMVLPTPDFTSSLPELPNSDAELQVWWQQNIAIHIKYNGLDGNWGQYADDDVTHRDLAFLRIAPESFNRFLALSHPKLFTDQPELLPDNYQSELLPGN